MVPEKSTFSGAPPMRARSSSRGYSRTSTCPPATAPRYICLEPGDQVDQRGLPSVPVVPPTMARNSPGFTPEVLVSPVVHRRPSPGPDNLKETLWNSTSPRGSLQTE